MYKAVYSANYLVGTKIIVFSQINSKILEKNYWSYYNCSCSKF